MIKIWSLLFPIIFILWTCTSTTAPESPEQSHFDFLLYDGLNESLTSGMLNRLNDNYERITSDLRVENMPEVTIRLWGDYNHFLNDMGTIIGTRYPGATGYVTGNNEICMYHTNDDPMTAVHEFVHLVSIQVNNTIPNNPRWLWEAVALYESQDFINPLSLTYMVSGNYPTLSELNTDYNSSNHSIYSVGYVLLEYVVDVWGMDGVINLIQNNGRIPQTLGITTQEFETGWHTFIEERYLH